MKNKILVISLGVLCGLLLLETGYLIGMGEQTARYRRLVSQRSPFSGMHHARIMGKDMPAKSQAANPIRQKNENFFVAAVTSNKTEEADVITVNLPGFGKKDLKIEVNGRYLTIQAKQHKEERVNKEDFYKEESSAANFVQRFSLPENAKPKQIRAEFNQDTLTITIPKEKQPEKTAEGPMNIPIK